MRLITMLLLSLLKITYIFALSSPIHTNKTKRNEECDKKLEEYSNCYNIGNPDLCDAFESNFCEKFYMIEISDIPECKSIDEDSLTIKDYMKDAYLTTLGYLCAKDEYSNDCPLATLEKQRNLNELTEEEYQLEYIKAVNKTCYSFSCTNDYIYYIERITQIEQNFNDYVNQLETEAINKAFNSVKKIKREYISGKNSTMMSESDVIDYLQSDECSAKKPEIHSKAYTTSKVLSFLISISLFILEFKL